MKNAVLVIQIVVAIALSITVLLQARGSGLGMTFGESSEQYRSKRGVEQLIYRTSIVLASLFFLTSLINLLIG